MTLDEIKVHKLGFYFVEIAIGGTKSSPKIIDQNKMEIIKLLRKFSQK